MLRSGLGPLALLLAASNIPPAMSMDESTASIVLSGTIEPTVQIGLITSTQSTAADALIAEGTARATPAVDPTAFFLGETVVLVSETSNVKTGYTLVFESIPSPLADSALLLGGTRAPATGTNTGYEFTFGGITLSLDRRRTVLTRPSDHADKDVRKRRAALRIIRRSKPTDLLAANRFRLLVRGP